MLLFQSFDRRQMTRCRTPVVPLQLLSARARHTQLALQRVRSAFVSIRILSRHRQLARQRCNLVGVRCRLWRQLLSVPVRQHARQTRQLGAVCTCVRGACPPRRRRLRRSGRVACLRAREEHRTHRAAGVRQPRACRFCRDAGQWRLQRGIRLSVPILIGRARIGPWFCRHPCFGAGFCRGRQVSFFMLRRTIQRKIWCSLVG